MDPPGFEASKYVKPDDPGSVYDWLLLSAAIAMFVLLFVGNGVIFVHRNRKFFQVMGWEYIWGSSVAAFIWVSATFVVNQHFRRVKFLKYCSLWTFWFQLTLGVCLWLAFMALRINHMYTFCTTGKPPRSILVWTIYIPLLAAPAVTFAIVATVLKVSHPLQCRSNTEMCVISTQGWRISAFLVLPPLYFFFVIVLLLRVHKIKDHLLRTQCQHIKDNLMMSFVLYLLTGTTYFSNKHNNVESRCFLTLCVCSIVFLYFWVHTGWPIYLCLFRGKNHMDQYENRLKSNGAACLREFSFEPFVGGTGRAVQRSFHQEEAIFQKVAEEVSRKDELKSLKEQLQRQLSNMRGQMEDLRYRRTLLPHNSQSMPTVRSSEKLVDPPSMARHLSLEMTLKCPTASRCFRSGDG